MARLRDISSTPEDSEQPEEASSPPARRITSESSIRPSPAPSTSSNKENHPASKPQPRAEKANTAPNRPSMSSHNGANPTPTSRKRKLHEVRTQPSQARHRRELDERVDKEYYDPDQDEDERRAVRKGMRDLNKELNGAFHVFVSFIRVSG